MIANVRQRNRLISRAPSNTAPTANATGNPAPISLNVIGVLCWLDYALNVIIVSIAIMLLFVILR
jgi:hypothetical protein